MFTKINYLVVLPTILLLQSSCALQRLTDDGSFAIAKHKASELLGLNEKTANFLESGTITLSFPVTKTESENKVIYSLSTTQIFEEKNISAVIEQDENLALKQSEINPGERFAPLLGFVPVNAAFRPADNEVWIELNRETAVLKIFKGKEQLKEIKAQGKITLPPGEYPLQHKQKGPLWYAPDEYFEKRQLRVPPRGDHFRYRRGALGTYALYPTMDFIIHSGPFWSEEIGGLRVNDSEIASIFLLVNVGAPVIVK